MPRQPNRITYTQVLSSLRKTDLVRLCLEFRLPTEGSVVFLRSRLKNHLNTHRDTLQRNPRFNALYPKGRRRVNRAPPSETLSSRPSSRTNSHSSPSPAPSYGSWNGINDHHQPPFINHLLRITLSLYILKILLIITLVLLPWPILMEVLLSGFFNRQKDVSILHLFFSSETFFPLFYDTMESRSFMTLCSQSSLSLCPPGLPLRTLCSPFALYSALILIFIYAMSLHTSSDTMKSRLFLFSSISLSICARNRAYSCDTDNF
jgi:hypothetical protein